MKTKMISLYMDVCVRIAAMSVAKRAQVGAVIVKDDNILAFGWNGTPIGWDNCCEHKEYDLSRDINGDYFPDTENRYPYTDEHGRYALKTKPEVLHAETNALAKVARGPDSAEGATLFCTHLPCMDCAKLIYQSGITEVYYRVEYDAARGNGKDFMLKSGLIVTQVA